VIRAIRRIGIGAALVLSVAGLLAGCGEPEPIKIGVLVPDTGPASSYGKSIRQGIELAVEEINAERPAGPKIVTVYKDTGTNVETAKIAFHELVETENVWAIIGPVSSSVARGLAPLAAQAQVVLLSPAASSPALTSEGGEYFFRNYPSDVVEGYTMAEFCRKLALASVAVVAADDLFGQGIATIFEEKYAAPTRKIVLREYFSSPLDEKRAMEIARKVAASKAEAVYIAAYQPDVAALLLAFDKLGTKIPRLATSAVTAEIVNLAGKAAEHLVFPQTAFDPHADNPRVRAFVDAYKAKYGEEPDNFAAHAYDAAKVLVAAIERAQIRKNLKGELWNIRYEGVTGNIDFDLNGDVVQAPRLYAVFNGAVVPYSEFREAMVGRSILAR